jgi:hypothetical protein
MTITRFTDVDRLSSQRPRPAELERTVPWLRAEEGRITSDQCYLASAESDLFASCYVIPHDCAHTAYATWPMLFGPPVQSLVDQMPDDTVRIDTARRLAELAELLPAAGTDALVAVTPGSTRPGITGGTRSRDDVHELLADVEDLAAERRLPVTAVANVRADPDCAMLHRVLRERGYVSVTTGADAVLDVPSGDLDSYFSGFRANRRKVLRKERGRFLDRHPSISVSGPAGLTADLVDLQVDRYARYGHRADAASVRDRFDRAATIPGFRVLRADGPNGPLGFVGFYQDGPYRRIVTRLGAFVRDDAASYFNIAYYELISYAAKAGGFRIHYGESTYGAKTARGCQLVRLSAYFRAEDPRTQQLLASAGEIRTRLEEHQLAAATRPGSSPTATTGISFDGGRVATPDPVAELVRRLP